MRTSWNKGVKISAEKRLLGKREILENGCWNFTGCLNHGYGCLRFNNKTRRVHRISASLYLGFDIESSLEVLHKCDNPSCFNPDHLFFGTQVENIKDMDMKKRRGSTKGEQNSHAKLSEKQVFEVIAKRRAGTKIKEISKLYSVSISTIERITNKRSWKHIQTESQ